MEPKNDDRLFIRRRWRRLIASFKKKYETWEQLISSAITGADALASCFEIDRSEINQVVAEYPMFINPYYLGLITTKGDAIYRQAVPSIAEITEESGTPDPLNEEDLSPVPGLTHKYPDRVLLLVSSRCAMYCRFCNRKRKVGSAGMVTKETIREGIQYISSNKSIRDVLLSGGDPLMLPDVELFRILSEIRTIPHVEIIRIGTRVPCTLPQRITPSLTEMLKGFQPLYVNTHFNHPVEITPESTIACSMLADAGIPLGCQTVLLKGVNDDAEVMKELMKKLVAIRVRPYYLFQADLVKGTSHFWTSLKKGLDIMTKLQGHVSGMCIPRFMIDLPDGGGKVPMNPEHIKSVEGNEMIIRNYIGREIRYPVIEE
jgi:lysine 2,3-aminomutase